MTQCCLSVANSESCGVRFNGKSHAPCIYIGIHRKTLQDWSGYAVYRLLYEAAATVGRHYTLLTRLFVFFLEVKFRFGAFQKTSEV